MSDVVLDGREVIKNLKDLDARTQKGLTVVGSTVAEQMADYAKNNHPWENRTGTAESRIDAKAEWKDTTLDISIKHGVDYGIWLEVCNGGKYAILEEARDSQVKLFTDMITAMKL